MIFDSHTHIDRKEILLFQEMLDKNELGILANASTIQEYKTLSKLMGAYISFGVHPWNTDKFFGENGEDYKKKLEVLKLYYENAQAVGEIGMDSVWCRCNLANQRKLFISQLDIAETLKKPVVLHTKGQEKQIAKILKDYSVMKLVHWYSCEEYLQDFIEQDCYFTVGVNFEISTAVRNVIKYVPLERLLVETDGMSAVEWAVGRKIKAEEIPSVLKKTIAAIAKSKNVEIEEAEKVLEDNFYRFIR